MKKLMLIALVSCCCQMVAMEGEMLMPKYDEKIIEQGYFEGWPFEQRPERRTSPRLRAIKKLSEQIKNQKTK